MKNPARLKRAIEAIETARQHIAALELMAYQDRQRTAAEVELKQAQTRLASLAEIWSEHPREDFHAGIAKLQRWAGKEAA